MVASRYSWSLIVVMYFFSPTKQLCDLWIYFKVRYVCYEMNDKTSGYQNNYGDFYYNRGSEQERGTNLKGIENF